MLWTAARTNDDLALHQAIIATVTEDCGSRVACEWLPEENVIIRFAVALVLLTTVAACTQTSQTGLRTSSMTRVEMCDVNLVVDRVIGWLRVQPADREQVWLEARDGRRISVVWPAGFRAHFGYPSQLINERGQIVAAEGQKVTLEQTRLSEATGTYDNPYVAHGGLFGACYI